MTINHESNHEPFDRVNLPYTDQQIEDFMEDPEASDSLFEESPVLWLRADIAYATQRYASEITDQELAARYVGGGFESWGPDLSIAVSDYLYRAGLPVTCWIDPA